MESLFPLLVSKDHNICKFHLVQNVRDRKLEEKQEENGGDVGGHDDDVGDGDDNDGDVDGDDNDGDVDGDDNDGDGDGDDNDGDDVYIYIVKQEENGGDTGGHNDVGGHDDVGYGDGGDEPDTKQQDKEEDPTYESFPSILHMENSNTSQFKYKPSKEGTVYKHNQLDIHNVKANIDNILQKVE